LDGPDFLIDDDNIAAVDALLCEIHLRERYEGENLQEDDAALMAKWRQKVTDVHHLTGHLMAGHDAFVTSDTTTCSRSGPNCEHEPGSWSSTRSRPSSSPTANPPDQPDSTNPPSQPSTGVDTAGRLEATPNRSLEPYWAGR
jgi:hypothetical protein